jgi:anti-sigma regulatory factor (Ser/Thr protein kinase)
MLLIIEEGKTREITIRNNSVNQSFNSYLNLISFGAGLKPETIESGDYKSRLDYYRSKTYIPIINFPATRLHTDTEIRDQFLGILNELLIHQLNLRGSFLTGIMYLLDEAINNIVDHSKEARGFIFAQYFPSKNFIDICVADSGITILGTYKEKGEQHIITDKDAISNAANGNSTKQRPENEGRGYGISTSKKMLVNGLRGKYLLLSGKSFLIKTIEKEEVIEIPDKFYWKGTIVALRVPYLDNISFNPSEYYEN